MASLAQPIAGRCSLPPFPALTDDLIEEILLRLPAPTDLARACAACSSFRRIITERAFLRRFRAIHPPPLLGFVPDGQADFYPAQPPHASAPLARALADASDFSYSFVPTGRWLTPWRTLDVRQGRVLLECRPPYALDHQSLNMRPGDLVLAVCDPIFRRYVLLPTIPGDLVAKHERLCDFGLFLVPTGEDEEEASFRVMCLASNNTRLVAFLYSSVTGHWCIVASPSWRSLGTVATRGLGSFSIFDYSQGCCFWTPWRERLLVLDTLKMEFSVVQNIPYIYRKLDTAQSSVCSSEEYPVDDYCLLDIKTSELKKVCGMSECYFRVQAYFGFPPSLSKPCI